MGFLNTYQYKGLFTRGKQGIAGLLESSNRGVVFKFSQNIDYATRHEYNVQRSLNALATKCQHFVSTHALETAFIDALLLKHQNPFIHHSRFQVSKEVMLMDYISDGIKLKDAIKSKLTMEQTFSIIKQVLQALALAQREMDYTHYDLHSNNIILKKCDPKLVMKYKQPNGKYVHVPTMGYIPIIIDHGFAYTKAINGERLYASMGHTKVGFYSDRFDSYADARLFLITVSSELKHYFPDDEQAQKLRRIVRNIYSAMDIDFYSGWDNYNGKNSASDTLTHVLSRLGKRFNSAMLIEGAHYAIDLVLSLNVLPLNKKSDQVNLSQFTNAAETFFDLFTKYIESVINNTYFSLYVLRDIVDAAATCGEDTLYFKNSVLTAIHSIAKFANPSNELCYDLLLSSLRKTAVAGGDYLASTLNRREKERQNEYNYVEFKTPLELFGVIDYHFE